ncbi:DUF1684 domain-containing protein [Streptomyces aquilus]|uniref:DUF1684 domain-containing protein n=1 Tax=Streptomyces aquilus TaxID=2548456 RepID=UPI00367AC73C
MLQLTAEADGSPWAVFGDTTNGTSGFRFRFPRLAAPDAEGRTTIDFDRALLPPRAFADHLICRFPPPGRPPDATVAAGSGTRSEGLAKSWPTHG